MKKRSIIIAISIAGFFITASAQEIQNADTVKKQYKCFVSIKTTNGDKIKAALSGLSADSVYLASVETRYIKAGGKRIKILREVPDTTIAVNQLRTFRIKYDPNIIYRDELVKRKKQLKHDNAGKIFEVTVATLMTIALIPVTIATEGLVDPTLPLRAVSTNGGSQVVSIPGNRLAVTENYRLFNINGKSSRYTKMVKHLAKSKTNPFESTIAKN